MSDSGRRIDWSSDPKPRREPRTYRIWVELHRFGLGEDIWDRDTELYLCRFDVEGGHDEGVPEEQVRLDEVLADVGDRLAYVYDYGDGPRLRCRGLDQEWIGKGNREDLT